ncbi:MAG TPA: hypothetical protein VGL53_00825 [Bryobacteraceae bacterium]
MARAETAGTAFPLVSSCFDDADRLGEVSAADSVRVRYASVAGGTGGCYAVEVNKDGKTLTGFLVGASLPAIQQFESEVRKQKLLMPPPPPPPAAVETAASVAPSPRPEPPPAPAGPSSLVGLRGFDMYGRAVDLAAIPATHVVVYFWTPANRKSTQLAEGMEGIYTHFGSPRKLEVVGVAAARDQDQLLRACQENEVIWPQILDRGQVASRYHVDPAKPYLLLDRSRKVVAAVASPKEMEAELRRIGLK